MIPHLGIEYPQRYLVVVKVSEAAPVCSIHLNCIAPIERDSVHEEDTIGSLIHAKGAASVASLVIRDCGACSQQLDCGIGLKHASVICFIVKNHRVSQSDLAVLALEDPALNGSILIKLGGRVSHPGINQSEYTALVAHIAVAESVRTEDARVD